MARSEPSGTGPSSPPGRAVIPFPTKTKVPLEGRRDQPAPPFEARDVPREPTLPGLEPPCPELARSDAMAWPVLLDPARRPGRR